MAMSRKHYIATANVLSQMRSAVEAGRTSDPMWVIRQMTAAMAAQFAEDNANFSVEKFYGAVGIDR